MDTGSSAETDMKKQEGYASSVKELMGCMELLYWTGNRLVEALYMRVRGEPS